MFWFKKKDEAPTICPKHEHVWKDMPWYLVTKYSDEQAEYKVIEPYICLTCGERKNVMLEGCTLTGISFAESHDFFKQAEEQYKEYLKPRAVVEDMINDITLVRDPDRLELFETMRGVPHSGVGTSSKNKIKTESNYCIKVK